MAIEVSKTGIDWVDKELKEELDNLKSSKFDKDLSINYLKNLDKTSWEKMMEKHNSVTILAIQILLKELWYASVWRIDGILVTKWKKTSRTMNAVKDFQRKNNIEVDGLPGPITVNKLLEKFENWWTWSNDENLEEESVASEITLKDLEKIKIEKLWKFEDWNFVFELWIEKNDKKWTYILIDGKKMYKLWNKKDGIFYDVISDSGLLCFGQYKSWKLNWFWWSVDWSWNKYVWWWKNGLKEGRWTFLYLGNNKDRYDGWWKQDDPEWDWVRIYPDWSKFVGEFKEWERWLWTYYTPDGEKKAYVDGKQVN